MYPSRSARTRTPAPAASSPAAGAGADGGCWTMLAWSLSVSIASPTAAASFARRLAAFLLMEPPAAAGDALLPATAPGCVMRAPNPPPAAALFAAGVETLWCKSCVHSPLTLPEEGTLALRPTEMARWGICCYKCLKKKRVRCRRFRFCKYLL